jgi:hypothetical protein
MMATLKRLYSPNNRECLLSAGIGDYKEKPSWFTQELAHFMNLTPIRPTKKHATDLFNMIPNDMGHNIGEYVGQREKLTL